MTKKLILEVRYRPYEPKIHPKIDTFVKIGTRDLTILGAKKIVFLTFWKLVWSCSEVILVSFWGLKDPFSGVFLARKIQILCQNLDLWEGHFDHFCGKKSCFLDFLKVVLELFRSCLGIIFFLTSPTFKCIRSSKCWYITSKIKIFTQILALWEGNFAHFRG